MSAKKTTHSPAAKRSTKTVTKRTVAKKTATPKVTAKKTVAKKTVAKKAAATRPVAKKSATRSAMKLHAVHRQSQDFTWMEILPVNKRGGVTLPKRVRDNIAADSPVVRLTEVGPGQFLFEIVSVVPIADRWYHTAEWQESEREASEDIASGRTREVPGGGLRDLARS